jgi:soluble lytic murein transglycosylase
MLRFRLVLSAGLLAALCLWLTVTALTPRPGLASQGELRAARLSPQTLPPSPYSLEPVLEPYLRYQEARLGGDVAALRELAEAQRGSYLEYRILFELARDEALDAEARAAAHRRLNEVMVRDPLAAEDERRVWLDYARAAEAAGLGDEALAAYGRALPLAEAVDGVSRLAAGPAERAERLMGARLYEQALEALEGLSRPSLTAPILRALGRHEEALAAYRLWLQDEPESERARYGEASSLFDLGRNPEADARFADLPGAQALSYRGHIARRAEDTARATDFYRRAGDAHNLWGVTERLEAEGRYREAIALYLELTRSGTVYADDAAYRAFVLAGRLGDEGAQASARALMPDHSYLGLSLGKALGPPTTSLLPKSGHPALELAHALARAGDFGAAIGELRFAAREAGDEASAADIAEALYNLGDFRQSYLIANHWLLEGSRDLRTWRLAYPRAYSELVTHQAEHWGVDPYLIWAVMRQESRYYPRAVSVSNAQGLMQVIPPTWGWLAELKRETPGDAFDPYDNIRYGTYYLRRLLDQFGGDLELVTAAYNGGPGYIGRLYAAPPVSGNREDFLRFIDRQEPREYIQQVMLNYHIYRALYDED